MFKASRFTAIGSLCTLLATPVFAVEYDVHGFLSQGFVVSQNTAIFDDHSENSYEMTQAGIKLGLQVTPRLSFSTQINYQRFGDYIKESVKVEHLMASYILSMEDNFTNGVKVGRLKPEIGLYNSTRDLPWTRPSIFMPKSIYPDVLRDGYFGYDGVSYFHDVYLEDSFLQLSFLHGKPNYQDETISIYVGNETNGTLDSEFVNVISAKWFYGSSWTFMLTRFENELLTSNSSSNNPIDTTQLKQSENIDFTDALASYKQYLFSIQYSAENWEFTSEFQRSDYSMAGGLPRDIAEDPMIGPYLKNYDRNSEAFYLQARYRLTDSVNITSRIDVSFKDIDDRNGEKFAENTKKLAEFAHYLGYEDFAEQEDYSMYAKSFMLGLQWSPTPSWMVSIEGYYAKGLAWTPAYYNIFEREIDNKYWSLYAAEIAYRF